MSGEERGRIEWGSVCWGGSGGRRRGGGGGGAGHAALMWVLLCVRACVRVCVYVCDFLGFVCVCLLVSLSGVSVTCQTVYLPLMCVFVRASARVKKYQSRWGSVKGCQALCQPISRSQTCFSCSQVVSKCQLYGRPRVTLSDRPPDPTDHVSFSLSVSVFVRPHVSPCQIVSIVSVVSLLYLASLTRCQNLASVPVKLYLTSHVTLISLVSVPAKLYLPLSVVNVTPSSPTSPVMPHSSCSFSHFYIHYWFLLQSSVSLYLPSVKFLLCQSLLVIIMTNGIVACV